MKFFVKTYGCQMNERDSDAVTALLLRQGYTLAACEAEAELLLVNTCSVRGKAEDKAIGKLGLLGAGKREHPGRLIGAIGCMAQRRGAALLDVLPRLDFVIGTYQLDRLPAVLERVRRGDGPVVEIGTTDGARPDLSDHAVAGVTAFVNILYGCDRRCAYCVVPYVRGPEWSRPMAAIEREVRALLESGVRDVTLLGQSVFRYGLKQPFDDVADQARSAYRTAFPRLLERLQRLPGLKRLRFTSGHPEGCTPELAAAMRDMPAVCNHLHLPVQSGSDRILKRMGRGYTASQYLEAVGRLRDAVPDLALTTDIIVGFPGETAADVEQTRDLMTTVGFDNAFIFKYSPRPGSRAAAWDDDVPDAEKRRRNQVLLEDQNERCRRIYRSRVGSIVNVLVEGPSARNAARWTGRSRDFKIVLFDPVPGIRPGDEVDIRIEHARSQTLYGEPLRDPR